jgi:N-methylhydantoinase B
LTERRTFPPYGLRGGGPGTKGRNALVEHGVERELPAKCNIQADAGDVLHIETPGGGGWGATNENKDLSLESNTPHEPEGLVLE